MSIKGRAGDACQQSKLYRLHVEMDVLCNLGWLKNLGGKKKEGRTLDYRKNLI